MNIYKTDDLGTLLKDNTYAGRGIVIGKTRDGKKAVFAYFIMGRSENSRNRIFKESDGGITIYPYDESKVKDPSLIIYSPVRTYGSNIIVTNGDQTDTVYNYLAEGKTFEQALDTRCFEPDAPNYTPRISGILNFDGGFTYKMSILKSADAEGSACNRFTYSYTPVNGLGHFLHTYICDVNPIPTFCGEPERVAVPDSIDSFTFAVWENLNADNKISLYTEYIDLTTGEREKRLINKFAR